MKKKNPGKLILCTQKLKPRLSAVMYTVCRLLDNLSVKEGSTKAKRKLKT